MVAFLKNICHFHDNLLCLICFAAHHYAGTFPFYRWRNWVLISLTYVLLQIWFGVPFSILQLWPGKEVPAGYIQGFSGGNREGLWSRWESSWSSESPGLLGLLPLTLQLNCVWLSITPLFITPLNLFILNLSSPAQLLYLSLLFSYRSTLWAGEILGLLEIFQSQKFGHWPQTSRIPRQIPTSRRLPSGCE